MLSYGESTKLSYAIQNVVSVNPASGMIMAAIQGCSLMLFLLIFCNCQGRLSTVIG